MSLRVLQTNVPAMQAQRRLSETSGDLRRVFERLSSGMRINRASDDAAGLSIASSLRADAGVLTQAQRNVNDAISLYSIAEGAATELSNILIRIGELAEQSANGVLANRQRLALDEEAQALRSEFNRIIEATEFNKLKLLNGDVRSVSVQAGYDSVELAMADLGSSYVGDGTFQDPTALPATITFVTRGADVNGDGITDLLSGAGNNLRVHLGTGAGNFAAPTDYATPTDVEDLDVWDVNNDGISDVVSHSQSDDAFYIQLGNTDGSFRVGSQVNHANVAHVPHQMADMNRDGNLDLVFIHSGATHIAMGAGDGTFASAVSYAGNEDAQFEVGDVNGDTFLDIVAHSGNFGATYVRLGNSNGSLLAGVATSNVGSFTELSDVNGDGILDAVGVYYAATSSFNYALGVGNGTFGSVTNISAPDWSRLMGMVDINGDGFEDAVLSSYALSESIVLLSHGDGTFGDPITRAGAGDYLMDFADVNNDGLLDMLKTNREVLYGNGSTVAALAAFSLRTQQDSLDAMAGIRSALNSVSAVIGDIGSSVSRLEVAHSTLRTRTENYESAASQILDADVAEEAARLVRLNILQQAASSILSQANQLPSLALRL